MAFQRGVLSFQWLNLRSVAQSQHYNLPSTHFATINPGTLSSARSASRARSSRLRRLTCGTSRKIGAVTTPWPVFDRDATARPLMLSRPSATSRLGPQRR